MESFHRSRLDFMGNSTRLFGDVFDAVYDTVIGNTHVSVSLFTEQGPIDIAQSTLNNTTGTFDIDHDVTNLRSDAYDFVVDLTSVKLLLERITHLLIQLTAGSTTQISTLGGIITEVVVEAERPAYIVEMNDTVSFTARNRHR